MIKSIYIDSECPMPSMQTKSERFSYPNDFVNKFLLFRLDAYISLIHTPETRNYSKIKSKTFKVFND